MVVEVETYNGRDVKVLRGTAEVTHSSHFLCLHWPGFSGVRYGNGTLRQLSRHSCRLECCRPHLLAVYCFSTLELVEDNPKEKTIHLGVVSRVSNPQEAMEMMYNTMDKNGIVRTQRYASSDPNGLLFAISSAQIALVVTEKAVFEDVQSKDFIQDNAVFAGHSLGEYSALASVAGVLPISSLVDVVLYRGITMQYAVYRDTANHSNHAMCAVNPSRIPPLREVADDISHKMNCYRVLVSRLAGEKTPASFNLSATDSYVLESWGLGPQRAGAVLVLGTTMKLVKHLGFETGQRRGWMESLPSCPTVGGLTVVCLVQ